VKVCYHRLRMLMLLLSPMLRAMIHLSASVFADFFVVDLLVLMF
jgi:hypothetical protein